MSKILKARIEKYTAELKASDAEITKEGRLIRQRKSIADLQNAKTKATPMSEHEEEKNRQRRMGDG
jgi:hypothetical protein